MHTRIFNILIDVAGRFDQFNDELIAIGNDTAIKPGAPDWVCIQADLEVAKVIVEDLSKAWFGPVEPWDQFQPTPMVGCRFPDHKIIVATKVADLKDGFLRYSGRDRVAVPELVAAVNEAVSGRGLLCATLNLA